MSITWFTAKLKDAAFFFYIFVCVIRGNEWVERHVGHWKNLKIMMYRLLEKMGYIHFEQVGPRQRLCLKRWLPIIQAVFTQYDFGTG